jgi:glycosyltransferase involved in cell wall biosynthesis
MKIVYCKTAFAGPISGADEIAVMYAVELKHAGHSTAVLLVHPPAANDSLAMRLRDANVALTTLASPAFTASLAAGRKLALRAMRAFSPAGPLIRSKSRNVVFDLMQRYHKRCCAYLRREKPDVVHVLTPDQGAMMLIRAAHACGVPVVYQEVGLPFHPPGFEEVYERFVTVLPLCSRVAVLSPGLMQHTSRALPQISSLNVLPLISHASNGTNHAERTSSVVRFGFAARLEYLKGPMQLIDGFRTAHQAHVNVELKIAGEGSQRKEMLTALRNYRLEQKCEFAGVYNTLEGREKFMSDIDVFVLPSLTEGTPNAIIEAMAHEKPIIATSVGGIPDLVDKSVGILVPPNDASALGQAMSKLAGDAELRRKMGLAARRSYEKLFTSRAVLPLLTDFYERLAKPGQTGTAHPNGHHPWAYFNS